MMFFYYLEKRKNKFIIFFHKLIHTFEDFNNIVSIVENVLENLTSKRIYLIYFTLLYNDTCTYRTFAVSCTVKLLHVFLKHVTHMPYNRDHVYSIMFRTKIFSPTIVMIENHRYLYTIQFVRTKFFEARDTFSLLSNTYYVRDLTYILLHKGVHRDFFRTKGFPKSTL
jgi:hypothetical protein